MKKRFLALALGTLAFGVTLGGVKMSLGHQDAMMVKAEENKVAYKTLSFPDENKANNKIGGYDKTWTAKKDGVTYTIKNFNNNNWNNSWTYIKCGSGNFASVATILTDIAIDKPIEKVVLNLGKVSSTNVNSIKMVVLNGDVEVQTIMLAKPVVGNNEFLITKPTANLKYKLVVDCKKSSNGIVQVNSLQFFEETVPAVESKVTSVELIAGTTFEKDQFKGNTFNPAGLSVKAHYEDSGIEPTDISLAKVKWVLKEDLSGAPINFVNTDNVILDDVAAKEYFLCAQYETFTSSEAIKLTIKDKVLVSAIEIALDSTSIESGKSTTAKIVSISPKDAFDQTIEWHTEDPTIASIDQDGIVKGLTAGSTEIYATAKDKGAAVSNRVQITVTEYVAKIYHQITSEQVDFSGTYLLGYKASATQAKIWNGEESEGNHNVATLEGDVLTGNDKAEAACLVIDPVYKDAANKKERTGYSVKVAGGPNDGLFLTTSGTTKKLNFGTKMVAYSVSYDSKNGVLIKGSDYALQFNSDTNAGNNRFRFYSVGTQQPVQLYRLDYTADVATNAKAFADKFVAAPICGTDDNTPANAGEFDKFVTEYSELSRDVRAYLANRDGESDASFKAFYDKYDAIMNKRASNTEFYDFLAGKYRPAKTQGVFGINQNITDSTTWTLVGIGAVTIAASASLLFFRRKKSN